MPIGPARMPLFDHLTELRMRLVRIVVCMVVAVCVFYLAAPTIGDLLLQPVKEFMPMDENGQQELVSLSAMEPFTIRFIISLWASLVACMPIILWQFLAFLLPALKPKERKWFVPTLAAAVALFIFGTVFCYFIILNPAFEWLTAQAGSLISILPGARDWIDLIVKFEIGFGLAFQLPLIVFYLIIFDIVPYKKLRASWRTVYIAFMVISAMVTPDASPVTMLLMFAAMVGLYEISLFISRLVLGSRLKEQTEAYEAKKAEEDALKEEEKARKQETKKTRKA